MGSASGHRSRFGAGGVLRPARRVHGGRADDRVGEPVGETVVAADQRAVVLRRGAPAGGVEGELHRDALARLPRHETAEVAAQRRRQHGLREQRQVQAGRAPASLALDLAVVVHEVRDVGDVHVRAVAGALTRDRDGVVEVARGVRVDGEGRQRREVAAAAVGARGAPLHRGRLGSHGVGEALAHALGVEQRPQHGHQVVRAAEDLDDPPAVAVRGHGEDEVVQPRRHAALGDEVGADVGEQGLERPELAPASDAVRERAAAVRSLLVCCAPPRSNGVRRPGMRAPLRVSPCRPDRPGAARGSWGYFARRAMYCSAVCSASSGFVLGLSGATMSGVMPFLLMFVPFGVR